MTMMKTIVFMVNKKTKVNTYDEYWNSIIKNADDYMNDFSFEDLEAFGWLCEGTYRIHLF